MRYQGYPNRLVLVRHGESEGNLKTSAERTRMKVGTNLYPLTERGRKQAECMAKWVRDHYVRPSIYCSYYARAVQTAELVAKEFGGRCRVDPRLAEAQRGVYHHLNHDEMFAKYPEEHARKDREGLYHYRPWGGENWPDVELRLLSFMQDVRDDHEGEDVLLVGHGHTFLLLQRIIEDFSTEEALKRYLNKGIMENAAITTYEFHGGGDFSKTLDNFAPWKEHGI